MMAEDSHHHHRRTLKRQKRDTGSTSWNTADETLVDNDEDDEEAGEDMGEMRQPTEEHDHEFARPRYYRDQVRQGGKRRALDEHLQHTASMVHCKFAKAGCPVSGTAEQVHHHEVSYCIPLYTRLAEYKMLALTNSATGRTSSSATSPHYTSLMHSLSSSFSSPGRAVSSLPVEPPQSPSPDSDSIPSLRAQLARMNADLTRLQDQLESEKRLRTERLRRASERVLQLMASTTLGEGKVEVLKAQLHAERELREKLEEELDSLRAVLAGEAASGAASRASSSVGSEPAIRASSDRVRQMVSKASSGTRIGALAAAIRASNRASVNNNNNWQEGSSSSTSDSKLGDRPSERDETNIRAQDSSAEPGDRPNTTMDNTHQLDFNRRIRPSQSQNAAAAFLVAPSSTTTAPATSNSEAFTRHRQHRREKASDGMSSSPLEMSTSTSDSLRGIDGVMRDLNGSGITAGASRRIRYRSPLRGVLKRQRKDSEDVESPAMVAGHGQGYGYAEQSEREVW